MINDIKLILMFVGVAIASAIIRFKTLAIAISDTILGFISGYFGYMLLSYFSISDECRCGVTGIFIMYARPIYDTINNIITCKLAEWIDQRVKK